MIKLKSFLWISIVFKEFLHNFHIYFHNALRFMLKSNQESLFKIFYPVVENYIKLDKNVYQ